MKNYKLILILVSLIISVSCNKNNDIEIHNVKVDQYIEQLASGNYDSAELPAFTYKDIPALILHRNEPQLITNFPRNGISSFYMRECKLGIYILWTIESIRAVANDSEYLVGRFPSQNPILEKKDFSELFIHSQESHEIVSKAYYDWWNSNKRKDFNAYKNIDPLRNTVYKWH